MGSSSVIVNMKGKRLLIKIESKQVNGCLRECCWFPRKKFEVIERGQIMLLVLFCE